VADDSSYFKPYPEMSIPSTASVKAFSLMLSPYFLSVSNPLSVPSMPSRAYNAAKLFILIAKLAQLARGEGELVVFNLESRFFS
jgi:hypothetical protein